MKSLHTTALALMVVGAVLGAGLYLSRPWSSETDSFAPGAPDASTAVPSAIAEAPAALTEVHDASTESPPGSGPTDAAVPSESAASPSSAEASEALAPTPAEIDVADCIEDPEQSLANAAEANDLPRVNALLGRGVDPNQCTHYGEGTHGLALEMAVHAGSLEMVDALLRAGANPNLIAPRSKLPLEIAIERRSLPLVKRLIAGGANVNAVNFGESMLGGAERAGDRSVIEALVAAGAIRQPTEQPSAE